MSEYYLSDHRHPERESERDRPRQKESKSSAQSQNMKVTLLGEFLFPSGEPQGFDPYNSIHGKSTHEAWRTKRDRR